MVWRVLSLLSVFPYHYETYETLPDLYDSDLSSVLLALGFPSLVWSRVLFAFVFSRVLLALGFPILEKSCLVSCSLSSRFLSSSFSSRFSHITTRPLTILTRVFSSRYEKSCLLSFFLSISFSSRFSYITSRWFLYCLKSCLVSCSVCSRFLSSSFSSRFSHITTLGSFLWGLFSTTRPIFYEYGIRCDLCFPMSIRDLSLNCNFDWSR